MMIHKDRIFSFNELKKEDELVEAMMNHNWPLCYSFYYGKLLYLNDSESENDPEYAVVTIDKTEGHHGIHGREVGRIRPRSMDAASVHKFIQDMSASHYSSEEPVSAQVEPVWHHSCQLCRLEEE